MFISSLKLWKQTGVQACFPLYLVCPAQTVCVGVFFLILFSRNGDLSSSVLMKGLNLVGIQGVYYFRFSSFLIGCSI